MSIAYGPNIVLTTARECCNLTPEDVAEKLGILDVAEYSKLESGETQITSDLAIKLGDIFNIRPELFQYQAAETINYNTGQGSHGGPIITYNNNSIWGVNKEQIDELLRKRIDEEIKKKG